jgi:hypothetical protein
MVLIMTLTILVASGVVLAGRGLPGSDGPERLVALAARHLPPERTDWGRAMNAELTHVTGRVPRWRFAGGVLRVTLFPPPRHRGIVVAVALAGLVATVTGTIVATIAAPGITVFAVTLGILLGGYATAVACRWSAQPLALARLIAAAAGLAGTSVAVTAAARIDMYRPGATSDPTHLFSVLLALALAACLALAVTPPALGEHASRVLWWALGGAVASTAVWVVIAIAVPFDTEQVTGYFSPVSAGAVLVVSVCVAASTRSMPAGAKAGVVAAVLGAPIHFAIDMSALLQLQHYALSDPFDVAAYSHSGFPTVASYLISDTLGGYIIVGLFLGPIALTGLALLGGAAGARLRPATPGRSAA